MGGPGCSSAVLLGLVVVTTVLSYIVMGLLSLHGALRNLYASGCGNVQAGFMHGLDVSTRCLVQRESLPLDPCPDPSDVDGLSCD